MGREELAALIAVLEQQLARGPDNLALGTWHIHFDAKQRSFRFDKCESEGYCEERPAVLAADGTVLDPGGPLFG
jgi:hypothetical protein